MHYVLKRSVLFGRSNITPKCVCNYLGITLDSALIWRDHVMRADVYKHSKSSTEVVATPFRLLAGYTIACLLQF